MTKNNENIATDDQTRFTLEHTYTIHNQISILYIILFFVYLVMHGLGL